MSLSVDLLNFFNILKFYIERRDYYEEIFIYIIIYAFGDVF